MIKALYQVEMVFKCKKPEIFDEINMKLYTLSLANKCNLSNKTEKRLNMVTFGIFEDYNDACKMHYKVKEVLNYYYDKDLIIQMLCQWKCYDKIFMWLTRRCFPLLNGVEDGRSYDNVSGMFWDYCDVYSVFIKEMKI